VSDDQKRVSRAVAWVGMASATVAIFDAITLALLMWLWVTPADLGLATLAVTLFYFLDLITEAGLGSVIIQRERLDDDTLTTVFWLNAGVSVVAYAAVFAIAPILVAIHGQPIVGWMLMVYGAKLLYQNLYFVPAGLLRRELRFKELSIVRTIANAGDVAGRIVFAALGEPVWCFVAGPLARVAITGIGLQICQPWRPRGRFLRGEARAMLSFGFKTTGSQYLQHYYANITYQVVGFSFGEAALGVYRIAYEIVLYPIGWVSNVVSQVAFPAFSRLRTDPAALGAQFLRFSRQNVATVLPILVLVLVAADELLAVLFPQVAGGATASRLLCVVGLARAMDFLYLPLLDGVGLPGRNLRVAFFAAILLTSCDLAFAYLLGPEVGYLAVVIGRVIGYPLVLTLHGWSALDQLDLPTRVYVVRIGRLLAWAAIAVAIGHAVLLLIGAHPPIVRLALGGGAGVLAAIVLLEVLEKLGPRTILRAVR
jgi:teichuronic acid exporter